MLSPLRLFLVVVFRLLAPLHMMAADAGSSSEGGGSAKKRAAAEEPGEPGSLDTLWEGFMTAQVNATHSNLRAIAHAGRLDDMRKIIWSSYNENPTECADTDLALNCKSQDKFIAYTLRQDLIPAKGVSKGHWKNQVNAFNKLVPKCKEFTAWSEANPQAFLTEEYIDKFVEANIECTTWQKIHLKINKPSIDAKEATKFLSAKKKKPEPETEVDSSADVDSTRAVRKSTRNSGKAPAKPSDKGDDKGDDMSAEEGSDEEDYMEEEKATDKSASLNMEEAVSKNPKLTAFLKQVKDKKGKMDVFVQMNALEEQLELSQQAVQAALEEQIDDLKDENERLRRVNVMMQIKWTHAKRQKVAEMAGVSPVEIPVKMALARNASQVMVDSDDEK